MAREVIAAREGSVSGINNSLKSGRSLRRQYQGIIADVTDGYSYEGYDVNNRKTVVRSTPNSSTGFYRVETKGYGVAEFFDPDSTAQFLQGIGYKKYKMKG